MLRKSSLILLCGLTLSRAATLSGRILLHQTPLSSLPVTLVQLAKQKVIDRTTTDEKGRFRFSIPSSPTTHYIVKTTYKKVPFFEGPLTLPKPNSKKSIRVQVYPVKNAAFPKFFLADLYSLQFTQEATFVERQITFYNDTKSVILPTSDFTLSLPEAFNILLPNDLLTPCCTRTEKNKVLIAQPLYPQENEFTFQYSLPRKNSTFSFSVKADYPTGRIAVVFPFTPLPIQQKGFQKKEKFTTDTGVYWAFQKENVKAGDLFSVRITLPKPSLLPYTPLLLILLFLASLFLPKSKPADNSSELDILARAYLVKEAARKK